jgi:hypothetical protein
MRKLFGNGRAVAAAILAVGVAAIAMPAFGKSDGGGATAPAGRPSTAPAGRPTFQMALPPPPPMSGAMRKKLDKSVQCMRDQNIPGAQKRSHGLLIPPPAAASKAFRRAAKECGAPSPPPRGALPLPAPGDPKARAKFDRAFGACVHAQRKR